MQKIATNYLNKKMPPIHEMVGEGIEQRWYTQFLHVLPFYWSQPSFVFLHPQDSLVSVAIPIGRNG